MNISMQILLKRALLLFGASMAAAIALDFGLRRWSAEPNRSELAAERDLASQKVVPWNGGKPQPRVSVSAELFSLGGDLFEFTLELEPQEKCDDLTVRVHGIDGVTVTEGTGGVFERSAICSEGVSSSTRVHVPQGVNGFVVVDIELRGGELGRRSFSRSFEANHDASGDGGQASAQKAAAADVKVRRAETMGRVLKMKNGEAIHDIEVQ